eukprot:CAMPEP_0181256790 /NCGR_PEP_ID=MMETSP1096-20121128/49898_1 /TAXON_ID=156174 ORGANISM="Chrysochromulina ericina, Strain CCMP281" /NCGR_SAMPLE_ID=MMETSP1096 /ASSEMBLY_ACC=CAM_ASM_000453 /LENGTH=116 /DNA_ID=CAMNT_0023355063 /DNA_START=618 /DNA_END=968 /DNA_ORIENTATION=-
MASADAEGEVLPSACIAVPLAAPTRSHMQVHGAGITLSGLGVAIPMGLVSRGLASAFGHGVGRREEWAVVRPAVFAAAKCLHETPSCATDYTVILSSGWEGVIGPGKRAMSSWGLL